ncbi:MAG: Tfp pilus biogenesis protein PilC [Parcubacteria group bacterium GW2011_GWA2_42_11]|nr:MAG: Tfp pilus biogenesis protein PilC [Parcubacteria group bacterium GW2011_GWA2_42_11]
MEFKYTVKNKDGALLSGVAEANDAAVAIDALQKRGFIILKLEPVNSTPLFAKQFKILQRVKSKELVNFTRQLSTLFSAQSDNLYFRQIISEVASDIEGGSIFSKALANHPKVFDDFFVNMIRSGEVSGTLENTLLYLADYLERQHYLNSKVKNAMVYPAFILFGFLVIGVLMMVMVIPNLTKILEESGQELPLATKAIIGLSDFLRNWGWLLLVILFGGAGYIAYLFKNSIAFRHYWHGLKIKIPILGKIFKKIYISRLADNLSTLITGGISILQALQVSADVVGNLVFRDIILEAKDQVRAGGTISGSFEKYPEIPNLVVQMIATGEQAGALDDILKKMSSYYSKEIDTTVDTLSQLIEPILIVVLGIGVAFLVAGILMPIYNIAGGM